MHHIVFKDRQAENSNILGIDFSLKKKKPTHVILPEFKYLGTKFVDDNLSLQVSYQTTYSCSNASISYILIWKMAIILIAILHAHACIAGLLLFNQTQKTGFVSKTRYCTQCYFHVFLVNTKRYYCMIIIKEMYMAYIWVSVHI